MIKVYNIYAIPSGRVLFNSNFSIVNSNTYAFNVTVSERVSLRQTWLSKHSKAGRANRLAKADLAQLSVPISR